MGDNEGVEEEEVPGPGGGGEVNGNDYLRLGCDIVKGSSEAWGYSDGQSPERISLSFPAHL